ncbi:MAG: hypothetical protein QI223_05515 [Candidatus Korarchaeota archaeon]|nr:hypothetical protein [Candidatus Korarchaeota archaeon]
MPKARGVIAELQEREVTNGGRYIRVRLEGKDSSYFDWEGKLSELGVGRGDQIAFEHTGGKYPRITRVERVVTGSGTARTKNSEKSNSLGGQPSWRDVQIVRMAAVKAAACLLDRADLPYEKKAEEITRLAEKLEQWVLR